MDEKEWNDLINSAENDFDNLETNKERAKRILKEKIIDSIKNNAANNSGVLFSGGIDSTLISLVLKRLGINFTCYSVGLENALDIKYAEKVAKDLKLKLKIKVLSLEEFERTVKNVVKILNENDVMKVGVASVVHAASLLAKNDNVNVLFSGLGSEELFTGYQRHEDVFNNGFEALHKECWNGLKQMWSRDISRDLLISKANKVSLRLPFLDKEVIKAAMSIHPMYKMDKNNNKIILREVAEELGLKKEFAWRKKKAAQYGSNFIKGMDKLTKRNGFNYKKDYLGSLL